MHVCIRYNMERPGCKGNCAGWRANALLITAALIVLSAPAAVAQGTNATGLTPLPSPEQVIQRDTDPYSGSLPQGKATGEVMDLSVEQALDMGLKYNLGLYLSDRATDQARAARLR